MAIKTYAKGSGKQLSTNFKSTEFDCHGSGCCSSTLVDEQLVTYLQKIRDHFGKPINISSGYRCATHNKNVGGATNSRHSKGQAADIYINGVTPAEIAKYAESIGILGIGLYETNADGFFVHVDTRTSKSFWYGQKEASRTTFGGTIIVADNKIEIDTSKVDTSAADPKVIWDYFKKKGLNDYGIAGLMGNLNAESALRPTNLQNTYEKKFDMTDAEYTAAVDSGAYTNFVKDSAGYGLAQWTYWSRKQNLLNFAKQQGKSIGDLTMQLDFLYKELKENYTTSVLKVLCEATSVLEASNAVLLKFERPADQSVSVQNKRASFGQTYYDKYAEKKVTTTTPSNPSSTGFKQRTTAPSTSDKYWIHTSNGGLNECIEINNSGSCLPNCVGYAWGRFYEITGKRPNLSRANAENWYGYTSDGYTRSQTPVQGAVICWRKGQAGNGSDGAGHVAIVEEVKSNGDVVTSNSAYGGTRFYMKTVTKASGYSIGSAYTFQGFILPPGSTVAQTPPATTPPVTNTTNGGTKMKYNSSNKPLVCMQTNSTCYKQTRTMTVLGVLWHSTGANNPNIKRYVQPSSNDANYDQLMKLLGKNQYGNDWNHISHQAGLNCWIGKLADGTVTTVQTMPWNYRPWGCGSGSKGSCNNGWIQFEICEDSLNDKSYFEKCYNEAVEITAYLCKMYNLNPKGTVTMNGVKVPVILDHKTSCSLGLGSNHGDVQHWFKKYGKTLDDVRNDVAKLLGDSETTTTPTNPVTPPATKELYRVRKSWTNAASQKGAYSVLENAKKCCDQAGDGYYVFDSNGNVVYPKTTSTTTPTTPSTSTELKEGDVIKLVSGATYYNGASIPSWIFNKKLYCRGFRNNGAQVIFSTLQTGAVTGVVNKTSIQGFEPKVETSTKFPYLVKVNTDVLNVRSTPSTSGKINTQIKNGGVYTIIAEQNGWGKLKSGAGWISLEYCKKL